MREELVNRFIAEIQALNMDVAELREEIKKLKQDQILDISDIDPIELLDNIDQAANSRE